MLIILIPFRGLNSLLPIDMRPYAPEIHQLKALKFCAKSFKHVFAFSGLIIVRFDVSIGREGSQND